VFFAAGSKGAGKKRRKKKPEPVSKDFGDDWQPPTPRPAIPPLAAQQIIARINMPDDTIRHASARSETRPIPTPRAPCAGTGSR
jgi:hypothetical protein